MKSLMIAIMVIAAIFIGVYTGNSMDKKKDKTMMDKPEQTASAVFAGGCFWCTESDFEKVDGVLEAVSGYTGGEEKNPTYQEVSAGQTGHLEAVKVVYDPSRIGYKELLDIFWRHVDPTDPGGQFVDRGAQYRSAVFYDSEEEQRLAEEAKADLEASGKFNKPIATQILPLGPFYPAENYHQDYYKNNPLRYRWYRSGSGRDQFLEKNWPDSNIKLDSNIKQDSKKKPDSKKIMGQKRTDE